MDKNRYPKVRKDDFVETLYNSEVADPYRWMEEASGESAVPKDAAELSAWIDKQNALTRVHLDVPPASPAGRSSHRDRIRARFETLNEFDKWGTPEYAGGCYFYGIQYKGEEQASIYVRRGREGALRKLVDPIALTGSAGAEIYFITPSLSGRLVAFGLSQNADDHMDIRVVDVATGEILPDKISGEFYPGEMAWLPDGLSFLYVSSFAGAENMRIERRVYSHRLGTDPKNDKEIFGALLPRGMVVSGVEVSDDGRYLLVNAHNSTAQKEAANVYVCDTAAGANWKLVLNGVVSNYFAGAFHKDIILVMTNLNSPHFKLMGLRLADLEKGESALFDVIVEPCEEHVAIGDAVYAVSNWGGVSSLKKFSLGGRFVKEFKMPVPGTISALMGSEDTDELNFIFTSFLTPRIMYRLDTKTDELTEVERVVVPGLNPDDFEVKRIVYNSSTIGLLDIVPVPMSIIHKKGLVLDGTNPAILYGYGGFNYSITPSYLGYSIPFLEDGGVYAIANIRGGGEFGNAWHEGGMQKNKKNVFRDFINAAEWLCVSGYTNKDRLAISGWSNGGLLTSAITVLRPEVCRAAIVGAPVADMLRFHKFPCGKHWTVDYGDPDEPEMMRYLLTYSPYHNVKEGVRYGAVLCVTAETDDRVHPSAAYKLIARMQDAAPEDGNAILIQVGRGAGGHGGTSGQQSVYDMKADILAFIYRELGVVVK